MFFKKKPKPTVKKVPAAPKIDEDAKEYQIPYSKNFRGFKRFKMVVYGNDEIRANNEKYYNKDFSESTFVFRCFNCESGERIAHLYIDGIKMGTIFGPDQLFAIENDLIEKVHVEPDEEVILGDKCTEVRHRITLIVKFARPDED